MTDEEALDQVKSLARQDNYVLTEHAKQQAIDRHMTDADIKYIILNPRRIVRRDVLPNCKEKFITVM